ncbi:ABC-type nickel/cobalt efflux system permease component RcnA [Motilibacter peucedani]|uniref:ABC-type nickel/cobalt efflux system permease component RcnA n=1 Tax=Motilibacter peucedani TaxID=598650 RepID=A0A420XP15_9ACTN|nr:sulfite exporter TauE/SafE family protein [Motilibacter peucedani]RKS73940.1 ABC-type nickel/cobalt efflux system permease component RcnA [Motilibacter peucedani]
MTLSIRRALLLAGVTAAAVVVPAAAASAHPLGNFTVNSYSGVVVSPSEVRVDHVMDYAEIPTVQQKRAIGGNLAAYAPKACAAQASLLGVTVSAQPVALTVHGATAQLLPGAAGLQTLRLECDLRAAVELEEATEVRFTDRAAADHVGWHEVTVRGDSATVSRSDAPATSVSNRLTAYPQDMLKSPEDRRSARFTATPGGARLLEPTGQVALVSRPADALSNAFTSLVGEGGVGTGAVVLALLLAAAIGAAHAVAPGHGKTVMAFYLAGRQARSLRAAFTVGTTVTLTHTAGVLVLGLLVSTGAAFTPAHAYPWLSMLSGLLVVAVGLNLVRQVRRGRGHEHLHGEHSHGEHSHGGHTHSHGGHTHLHGGHSHGPVPAPLARQAVLVRGGTSATTLTLPTQLSSPEAEPEPHPHSHDEVDEKPRRSGLVAMGLAGGLVPSPTAVVVLLGAVATGHWWLGVVLVVAFGLGMAVTLTAVGIAVATAGERLTLAGTGTSRLARAAGPVLRWAPALAAVGVCTLGVVVVVRGLLAL